MKTNKQGISLIVLVITIIIMIILAAAIIISLENTGVIGAAENAVCKTNIKQAKNLAVLTWSNIYTKPDEYTLENIEEKLKKEFEKNGLKYEDYNVEITKNGIDISSKSGCTDSSGLVGGSGNNLAANWSYAYVYDGTNWATISEYNGTEPVGTIVMKAYKNGTVDVMVDEDEEIYESYESYKLIVSGQGTIEGFYNYGERKIIEALDAYFEEAVVTELVIEEGITSIGKKTFQRFENCKTVSLPSTLTTIGSYAFRNCGFESLIIPDSVTQIDTWAFENCSKLESLRISNNLTTINARVFESTESLKNVVIPDSVTIIGERAFAHSGHFDTIVIPSGITSMSFATFENCTIDKIYFKGTVDEWNTLVTNNELIIPADTVIEYNYTGK